MCRSATTAPSVLHLLLRHSPIATGLCRYVGASVMKIVVYASACVLRNKMTCAMKLDYSEEEVRNVNLTL